MNSSRNSMVLILTIVSLAGCAQSTSKPNASNQIQVSTPSSIDFNEKSKPVGQGGFESSTLYSLLVAELAGHHGLQEVTLHHYLQEAVKTEDVGIIKRAVEIAEFVNDDMSLLEAALLWAKVEQADPEPFNIASEGLIRQGRFEEAQPLLARTLELGGLDAVSVINTLSRHVEAMKPQDRQAYLALFDEALLASPNNAHYLFAKATLLTHERQYEEALMVSQKALQSDPKYTQAIVLVAELQDQLGHLDTALKQLEEHLVEVDRRRYRNHTEYRLVYTRLLMKKSRFAEAETQAEIIALKNRHDEKILYHLGILMLGYERLELSERYFSLLPDLIGLTGELQYYLGRIAQLRGHSQQALEYFSGVDDPRYMVASFNEIGNLLSHATDQSKLAQIFSDARGKGPNYAPLLYGIESHWLVKQELNKTALSLLNEALAHYPDDVRLLHNRAMLWEKLNDQLKLEMDLRHLLKVSSNNGLTLNTLGYSILKDQPQSHNEVAGFIRPAFDAKTGAPAFLDSMGWVLHSLGDLESALEYLKKAYDIYPEPEIAAHLGTVYWKLGYPHLALEVWDNSLKEYPNRIILNKLVAIAGDTF